MLDIIIKCLCAESWYWGRFASAGTEAAFRRARAFTSSCGHTAVTPPLTLSAVRPPFLLSCCMSQGLTDLYQPARSVISSAFCRLLSQTHSRRTQEPLLQMYGSPVSYSALRSTAVWVEGLTHRRWSDELNRTRTPRLSLWRSFAFFFCRLCCFWLRQSNRFPAGVTMAGGKEEASALADLGPPQKQACDLSTPAAGGVECSPVVSGMPFCWAVEAVMKELQLESSSSSAAPQNWTKQHHSSLLNTILIIVFDWYHIVDRLRLGAFN